MKKEKQVRSYKRRTKSGKTVTVKAHTAKYEAADEKAKEVSKKPGAGKELEERKKKPVQLEIPFGKEEEKKVLDEVKETTKKESSKKPAEKKTTKKVRPVGSGTNGPTPKKESKPKATKTVAKSTTSEPAFTAAEFKEWYRGTGSAADKKVAKALRAQLGRSGYRKLEDEAIDNYTSRGHLSMFKRVSGGSSTSANTKNSVGTGTNGPEPKSNGGFTEKQLRAYGRKLVNARNKYRGGPGPDSYRRALKKRQEALAEYHKTDEGKAMRSAYRSYVAKKEREWNKKWTERAEAKKLEDAKRYIAEHEKKKSSSTKKRSVGTGTNGPEPKKTAISEQSLNSKGFKTFKMPQVGTLYLGKKGKGAYIKFKGKRNIQRADIDDYGDFITGHNGLTKAQKKQLSSLGYTEHEEY